MTNQELPGSDLCNNKTKIEQPWPQIQGIDIQSGLSRVGGNEKLYRSLLVKFFNECPDSTQQIQAALQKEDWQLATRVAHTIKGVAGNLGAKELMAASADLEAAIRNNKLDNIKQLLDIYENSTQSLMNGLKDFVITEEASVETGEQDKEQEQGSATKLNELLDKLQPFVLHKKPKLCKEIMAEINEFSWPDFTAEIAELGRLIGKYKFKDAQKILDSLFISIGK
jgi:HPt (histidine-containing phosphotransfer) domain-containing protein